MRRREFITLLGGSASAWPLAVRAQQPAKLPTIGFLGATTPSGQSKTLDAFVQRLRELAWIEGRTIAIEYRWEEGRTDRTSEFVAEFIRSKVDVIVAQGVAAAVAKQATTVIPIVFPVAIDPLGTGLVGSLARPGGNVTGLSTQQTDLVGKRVELLREVVPNLRRLAIVANVGRPSVILDMAEVERAARTLGIDGMPFEIRQADDIAKAFEALKGRADALYVCTDPFIYTYRTRINTMALAMRLPTVYALREYVEAGGLISYGADFPALFRRAADYVDKILRGAKPADIPVEQPTKFELIINLTTAKALGLTIPESFLLRADEVIE